MTPTTRRNMLKISLAGAGTLILPGSGLLPAAAQSVDEPHFFLMIVLNGGADCSYMFDARPLSMTKAGKIQNYLKQDPAPFSGRNSTGTLATSLVKPLLPFRDRFSILNGVYMTPSFDGHLQNMNFLFTGNPFGGDSFIPHLNLAETGREPRSLDSVLTTDSVVMSVNNHSSVVPLRTSSVGGLAATLKQVQPLLPGNELSSFILNVPPGYRSETVSHAGEEILYVLEGAITQRLDDQEMVLCAGDSLHFRGNRPHSWSNHTADIARLLWTGTLPMFRSRAERPAPRRSRTDIDAETKTHQKENPT